MQLDHLPKTLCDREWRCDPGGSLHNRAITHMDTDVLFRGLNSPVALSLPERLEDLHSLWQRRTRLKTNVDKRVLTLRNASSN